MAEIAVAEKNKRFYFNWVPDVVFHPRRAFQNISSSTNAVWLTPLLILSCLVLINVLVAGRLKSQAALIGEISYPPDFQYYTPEQQAQYTQAIQSTQGPVFVYVLPAITSLLGVWFGWLILGGILHLVTTLLGGRGNTAISMNIVAWGSLPLAVRAIVQIIYMFISNKIISNPGLSGFSPVGDSGWLILISQILRLIDIYIIWQILLLILGVRLSAGLTTTKSSSGVIFTVMLILLLQAGISYLGSLLGNLTITRPFFF
ncbi:MAG: Yip1 family protein [Anaerolineales bacterium]